MCKRKSALFPPNVSSFPSGFSQVLKSRIQEKQGLTYFLKTPYLGYSYSLKGRETAAEGEHDEKQATTQENGECSCMALYVVLTCCFDVSLCCHASVRFGVGTKASKGMDTNRNQGGEVRIGKV